MFSRRNIIFGRENSVRFDPRLTVTGDTLAVIKINLVLKNQNKTDPKRDYSNAVDSALGILLFIFVLWLWKYSWEYIDIHIKSDSTTLSDVEARGLFGDKFGAVNALFSALAFAGIIFSIFLQRRDLRYQRQEIIETRKEFIVQNNTLKVQRFENTFFNILNLHHQIIAEIDFRYYKKKEKEKANIYRVKSDAPDEKEVVVITGRDVFRYRYNKLFAAIQHKPLNYHDIYLLHYSDAKTDFGHYQKPISND